MFSPVELAVAAGVAVLLFGADKLPKLARSMGQAKKEFLTGQDEANASAAVATPREPVVSHEPIVSPEPHPPEHP